VDLQTFYSKITNEYSAKILNWAVKKTGNRPDGEDLAQEALLQVFIAATKQERIEKLENFIWKIAHFTWCNYTRALVRNNACELSETLPDNTDFTLEYAENDALTAELSRMRHKIANLSKTQREAVILHYLDGLPVREVAVRLGISETAAAWHLFDARKKVKKELESMKNETSYVYNPGKMRINASGGMSLSASGDVPQNPDTDKINDSLIRQNLCLLCRGDGKTLDELAELTGVSKPYLEYDVDWLTEREFLVLNGKRYRTSFIVMNQKYFEYRKEAYSKYKNSLSKTIIGYLRDNESKIRDIGFYGSDFPAERLMWALITLFISYASRNSALLLRLKSDDNREIHSDGGKYHVMAFDSSDGRKPDISGSYNNSGWEDFYGIVCDNFKTGGFERYFWLGVYNFAGKEARPEIVTGDEKTQAVLYKLYCDSIKAGFSPDSLNADEKEKLAEAVGSGLINKNGDTYKPSFVVFTKAQHAKFQNEICAPLLTLITPKLDELAKQFDKIHKSDFPNAKQGNIDHHKYLDLWMFGIFTLIFATEDEVICLPNTPTDGASLTLILIK
jgi:RNA polymerase sigma factor (sigma-70 family)